MLETDVIPMWPLLATAMAFLAPLGVALIAVGGLSEHEARQAMLTPLTAFALAAVGYVAVGFGLHYGGIGLIVDHPQFNGLIWEWSALGEEWGSTWGMAGLAGFGMKSAGGALPYLLLLSTLPWATTAVMLPMLALRGRVPAVVVALFGALTAAVAYPLIGNWVQGGGWLANLGYNIGAGHGFVDFGGAGLFLLGGGVALAGMLAFLRRRPRADARPELPPVHLPLLAVLGAGLLVAGTMGWLIAWPLTDWTKIEAVQTVASVILAAAGGGLAPLFYTWFVAGHPDPLQGARGVAAGWVAGLAAAPFLTLPWALVIGVAAGLLVVLLGYFVDHVLRIQDPAGVLVTFGFPALLGILAVGLFANGATGVGYNGIGADAYLGVADQGVTGLWPAAGWLRDWPGQFLAQGIGVGVIFLLGFLATSVLAAPLAIAARAWRGKGDEGAGTEVEVEVQAPTTASEMDAPATSGAEL